MKRPVTTEISTVQARGKVFKAVVEYILDFPPYFGGFIFDHTATAFNEVNLLVDFHA